MKTPEKTAFGGLAFFKETAFQIRGICSFTLMQRMLFRIVFPAVWLGAALLLNACNSGPKLSPAAYNDSLVLEQIKVTEAANQVQEVFDTYVKEDMQTAYNRFSEQIERSVKKAEALGDFEEDASFKDATLAFLKSYQSMAGKEYKEALQLLSKDDSTYSESDEQRLQFLYKQIDAQDEKATSAYMKAQDAFAMRHKLKLKDS
jgi:hypothetical protein